MQCEKVLPENIENIEIVKLQLGVFNIGTNFEQDFAFISNRFTEPLK